MLNFINNEFNERGGCLCTCMTLRTVAAEVKKYMYILLKIWDHCIYLLFVRQEHLV